MWFLYGYVCVCLFASVFEVAWFVCALFCSLINDCCFVLFDCVLVVGFGLLIVCGDDVFWWLYM